MASVEHLIQKGSTYTAAGCCTQMLGTLFSSGLALIACHILQACIVNRLTLMQVLGIVETPWDSFGPTPPAGLDYDNLRLSDVLGEEPYGE
jgi:hypothetical protein